MILRALQSFASLFCLLTCSTALAQGTIQTGFEEYPLGATPPFVSQPFQPPPMIANSTTVLEPIQPFEGQQFLWANGILLIKSPDGFPIQSFKLHAFCSGGGSTLRFSVAGQPAQTGSWQTIESSYATPVQGINISALDMEALPYHFAIDAVEFTTVPEPQTFWLLTLGLGAILLRRSKSLKTQSG